DTLPSVVGLIEEAERNDPSPGPFRVQRVEQWHPSDFIRRSSRERLREVVHWEHDTLDRLHGLPFGLEFVAIRGLIDLEDYNDFFEMHVSSGRDSVGVERPIFTHPRRGYDLWNARYFLMPVDANGWLGADRRFTRIAPSDEVVENPQRSTRWVTEVGWQ